MRRLSFLLPLAVAACAAPAPQATIIKTPPPVIVPAERGDLAGLSQGELQARLGPPALTVPEGGSLKLQWRAASCVLDAYLYGDNGGLPRVKHVEARTRAGLDTNTAACLALLSRR